MTSPLKLTLEASIHKATEKGVVVTAGYSATITYNSDRVLISGIEVSRTCIAKILEIFLAVLDRTCNCALIQAVANSGTIRNSNPYYKDLGAFISVIAIVTIVVIAVEIIVVITMVKQVLVTEAWWVGTSWPASASLQCATSPAGRG